MSRTASLIRTTSETDIALSLDLDGSGRPEIATGIVEIKNLSTREQKKIERANLADFFSL